MLIALVHILLSESISQTANVLQPGPRVPQPNGKRKYKCDCLQLFVAFVISHRDVLIFSLLSLVCFMGGAAKS